MFPHSEQGHEFELADEDEIVVFGEVFEKKADLLEDVGWDEVGIIDDEDEAFAALVEFAGFADKAPKMHVLWWGFSNA